MFNWIPTLETERLILRNGFVLERIKKEDYLIDGTYVDSGIHALLKKDFYRKRH